MQSSPVASPPALPETRAPAYEVTSGMAPMRTAATDEEAEVLLRMEGDSASGKVVH